MAFVVSSVGHELEFRTTLRHLMTRPTHVVTPGWLSKISGIPKASIVNWLEGRASRPRSDLALQALCESLRLTVTEATKLYEAAGATQPPGRSLDFAYDYVPVGLYRTTLEGRILFANATLRSMLGYTDRRQYQELDVSRDLYARPQQRRRWIAKMEKVGMLLKQPVWAMRADGSCLLVLDSAAIVRDERGGMLYYEGFWERAEPPSRTLRSTCSVRARGIVSSGTRRRSM